MKSLADEIVSVMRSTPGLPDGWSVTEKPAAHPLEKNIAIETPGFEMPAEAKRLIRELAENRMPAAYKTTIEFT